MSLVNRINTKLLSKEGRTANVVRNTLASAVMKVSTLLCSLLIVPITINYLNAENYGIWMAMSSILYWFAFFDVGLGNGMRNYLAQALSNNEHDKARSYFSTAMFLLSAIAIILGIVTLPLIYFLDLNNLFNAHNVEGTVLATTLSVAVIFSLIQFVVKNIGMVYIAMQKYAVNDFIVFLGSISSVLLVFIFTKTTTPHLLYVVVSFTVMPVLMFALASIPLLKRYPWLKPDIRCIDMVTAGRIVSKGIGFFVIQITSCLFIFGSANIFISHFCGPEQVTVYNVAYKLFNVLVIVNTILISPLWNAYTDAAAKGDYAWIRKSFMRSLGIWLLLFVGGGIMLLVSPYFFEWWVGDKVCIPFAVSAAVFAYVSMFNLANCAAHLLNGLNIICVHIITSVVMTVVYLSVVYFDANEIGVVGIALAMAVTYLVMALVYLFQCHLVISRKAKGIWLK